jgi:hypothetical protein
LIASSLNILNQNHHHLKERLFVRNNHFSFFKNDGFKSKSKKKTKHAQSFISEKSDGIVDLLDPSAAQLVTTNRPTSGDKSAQNKPKSFGDFEIAPDGRIIIKVAII